MKLEIPEISFTKLRKLAAKIKPLVRDDMGRPRTIKQPNLRNEAYTWSPKMQRHKPLALETLGEFECLHRYSYYGFFKPSVAEVLAQMPEQVLDYATHFEIVKSPGNSTDLNDQKEALNAGFHVSTVRVYGAWHGTGQPAYDIPRMLLMPSDQGTAGNFYGQSLDNAE